MTTPAAALDKPTAHCFKCRDRRTYTRLLASRPVYSCDGCGATREIEELGRVEIQGRISPVPAPMPRASAPTTPRKYTNRRKETAMKKSPLIEAIEKIVEEKSGGITEARVREIVQEELLNALADGAGGRRGRTAPSGDKPKCPRGVHKGIHGRACREAGYVG